MVAVLKKKQMTIKDALEDIYNRFGYHTEKTVSVYMRGISGMEDMKKLMESMRNNPLKKIDDVSVVALCDYKKSIRYDFVNNEESKISMDIANVLIFELENGGFFAMRPSGTEPKIKLYYSVVTDSGKKGEEKVEALDAFVKKTLGLQ